MKSTVKFTNQVFQAAPMGKDNPLPDMDNLERIQQSVTTDDSLSIEDTRYYNYGHINTILPYTAQNGYSRKRREVELPVVTLGNGCVEALFLPWMGGKLSSLRVDGRELLFQNPVVQPCNLAIRNAWCSGGVEWNVGIRGHHMLTCEDLFTELLNFPDGTAGVRFYEFERKRGIVYRIEAYLPPESTMLFVQMTIENPKGNGETPMYWWSNTAVREEPETRVIAPAEEAILTGYFGTSSRLVRAPIPFVESADVSKPITLGRSIDVFYYIPVKTRKFVSALNKGQQGLVQTSTDNLTGRKLFMWGHGKGGRHWQDFLAPGDGEKGAYIEIQSGLARTQFEHIPMPDGSVWTWLEAYTALECDVNGLEYADAVKKVSGALDQIISAEDLEREKEIRGTTITEAMGEIVYNGSGWGALENEWRKEIRISPLSGICRFPSSSLGEKQKPWLALLRHTPFPEGDPARAPDSYLVSPHWLSMMESSQSKNWFYHYHLGVSRAACGKLKEARAAFVRSVEERPNAWAYRCIARLDILSEGEAEEALEKYRNAIALCPNEPNLFLEYCVLLHSQGKNTELLREIENCLPEVKTERLEFLKCTVLCETGAYDEALDILKRPLIIPDMREGELSLSELWYKLLEKKTGLEREQLLEQYPLPYEIDFRMR